jgi:hypothetical protein
MRNFFRIAIVLLIFLPYPSQAGWEITGRYIDSDGNIFFKRYFIEDNIVKVERYNLIYVCNLRTEDIIIVDPIDLLYAKTTLSAYRNKVRESKTAVINELLEVIPDGQKKQYESLFRLKTEQELILKSISNDSLSIRQMNDSAKLLGYRASNFIVTAKGRKLEEFYFTRELDISSEFDLKSFLQYVYLLEPEDNTVKYIASEQYFEIIKKGFVLRRFIFENGYRSEWQVNLVEQKSIPAYEFGIPDLCKEVSLDKWFDRKNQAEEKIYDDYE